MSNVTFATAAGGTLSDHRQTLRRAVKLRARIRDRGAARFDIQVVDLSPSGFRAETLFRLEPGQIVWITLPGFQGLEAEVAWTDGIHVGAKFRQPLHFAVFEHIVELGGR